MAMAGRPPPGEVYAKLLEQSKFGGADEGWEDAVQTLNSHIDEFVDQEWRALESSHFHLPQKSFAESQLPVNAPKNRYTDVVPYDESRVKLRPIVSRATKEKVEGSDYFNANWVKVYGSTFIAAHAPPPVAFPDWYRMLWEARVSVVVMLTGWVEGRRKKADNYLPGLNHSVAFGTIEVQMLSEEQPSPNYIVRVLKLVPMTGKRRERIVRHFHYLRWPDQGVPDESESMLEMMQRVHADFEPSTESRQLVHCSAGIGRTGVWCSLSSMMQTISEGIRKDEVPELSVMQAVHDMRQSRAGMMQRYEQYMFTYKTMLNHLFKIDLSTTYRDQIKSGKKTLLFEDVLEQDVAKKQQLFQQTAQILRSAIKVGVLNMPEGSKSSEGVGSWTERVVVLTAQSLYILSGTAVSSPGTTEAEFPLKGLLFEEEPSASTHKFTMHLKDAGDRHFQLAANSEKDMEAWCESVGTAIDVLVTRDAPATPEQLKSVLKSIGITLAEDQAIGIAVTIDRLIPIPPGEGEAKLMKKVSYRLVMKMFTRASKNRAVWRKKTKWKRQLQHGESSAQTQSRPLNYNETHEISRGVEPSSRLAIYIEQLRGKDLIARSLYKVGPLFQPNHQSESVRVKFEKIGAELEFSVNLCVIQAREKTKRFSRALAELPSTMRGDQHIASGPATVFGVPMDDLMVAQKPYYPNFQIPILFKRLVDAMLASGVMSTEGVFRSAPNMRQLEVVRDAIDAGETVGVAGNPPSVHVACGILKEFLRELPDPLVHNELYEDAISEPYSVDVIQKLKPLHRNVFTLIIGFLQELLKPEIVQTTKMDAPSLAALFAPLVLRCPYDGVALMSAAQKEAEWLLVVFAKFDPRTMGNFLGKDDVAANAPQPIPTQPGPQDKAGAAAAGSGASPSTGAPPKRPAGKAPAPKRGGRASSAVLKRSGEVADGPAPKDRTSKK